MALVTRRKDGTEVNPGDIIKDFRGNEWTFIRATRPAMFGKSGKVLVDAGYGRTEFYETVFDLTVSDD